MKNWTDPQAKPSAVFHGSVEYAKQPKVVGAGIGFDWHLNNWASANAGLKFMQHEHNTDMLGGLSLGVRASVPGRVSPYVGVGVFGGYSKTRELAPRYDRIDNDNDGFVDEFGETRSVFSSSIATFYPEAGVHVGIGDSFRLSVNASYHYTIWGRDSDYEQYSISFGYLSD